MHVAYLWASCYRGCRGTAWSAAVWMPVDAVLGEAWRDDIAMRDPVLTPECPEAAKNGAADAWLPACETCEKPYNTSSRRPKVLVCGHALCLQCARTGRRCVWDPYILTDLSDLKDDEDILSKLQKKTKIDNSNKAKPWLKYLHERRQYQNQMKQEYQHEQQHQEQGQQDQKQLNQMEKYWCKKCAVLQEEPCVKANHLYNKAEDMVRSVEAVSDLLEQNHLHLSHLYQQVRASFKRVRDQTLAEQMHWQKALQASLDSLDAGDGLQLSQTSEAACGRVSFLQRTLGLYSVGGPLRVQLGDSATTPVQLDLSDDSEESQVARLLLLMLHEKGALPRSGEALKSQNNKTLPNGSAANTQLLNNHHAAQNWWTQEQNQSRKAGNLNGDHPETHARSNGDIRNSSHPSEESRKVSTVFSKNKPAVRALVQKLYQSVLRSLSNTLSPLPLPLPRELSDSSVPLLFSSHQTAALKCLSAVVVQKAMEEIRDAGCFSVLVDSIPVPPKTQEACDEPLELVSMSVRFCRSKGDAVEQLIGLEDSRSATGLSLYLRLTSSCESHGVDWRRSLRGVALDEGRTSRRAGKVLLELLQKEAHQAIFIWNGMHTICELICQACRNSVGRYFWQSLEDLQDFFGEPQHLSILSKLCGKTLDSVCDLSREDMVRLVAEHYSSIIYSLNKVNKTNSLSAQKSAVLAAALFEPEFLVTLCLFDDIFKSTCSLQACLSFSTPRNVSEAISLCLLEIRSKTTQQGLRKYLVEAEAKALYSPSDDAYALHSDQAKRMLTTASYISKTVLDVISTRFEKNIGVVRNIDELTSLLAASRGKRSRSELLDLFRQVDGIDLEKVGDELVALAEDFRWYLEKKANRVSLLPCDVLRSLMSMQDRKLMKERYPNMLKGIRFLCTVPLLPIPAPAEGSNNSTLGILRGEVLLLKGRNPDAESLKLLEERMLVKSFGRAWDLSAEDAEKCVDKLILLTLCEGFQSL